MLDLFEIIPGPFRWLFWVAIAAFYGIGWVAWRVQNDCVNRGYGPVATTFWSVGTLFLFFPIFPVYLLLRDRLGVKPGAPIERQAIEVESAAIPMLLCPSCGTSNAAVLTSCLNCGQVLGAGKATTLVGSVSCPLCGSQNPVGSERCAVCAAVL